MPTIHIYEPALSCDTGVCGVDLDETARAFMNTVGSQGLPLTVVDGVTIATGAYPSKQALLGFAGLGTPAGASAQRLELGLTENTGGGCCGGTGCC